MPTDRGRDPFKDTCVHVAALQTVRQAAKNRATPPSDRRRASPARRFQSALQALQAVRSDRPWHEVAQAVLPPVDLLAAGPPRRAEGAVARARSPQRCQPGSKSPMVSVAAEGHEEPRGPLRGRPEAALPLPQAERAAAIGGYRKCGGQQLYAASTRLVGAGLLARLLQADSRPHD